MNHKERLKTTIKDKLIASEVLFERNNCSTSASTLNAACQTSGDKAFHTDVLPAKCVKFGLHTRHKQTLSFFQLKKKKKLKECKDSCSYSGVVTMENQDMPSGSAIFETTKNLGTMKREPAVI